MHASFTIKHSFILYIVTILLIINSYNPVNYKLQSVPLFMVQSLLQHLKILTLHLLVEIKIGF